MSDAKYPIDGFKVSAQVRLLCDLLSSYPLVRCLSSRITLCTAMLVGSVSVNLDQVFYITYRSLSSMLNRDAY